MGKRSKKFPKKKKFGSNIFSIHSYHFEKKEAQASAKSLRNRGYNARVVCYDLEPRGADRCLVYKRKR